ncbi:uncharacterized protein LOC135366533 isoform X2 [Ornithodoros turicata]
MWTVVQVGVDPPAQDEGAEPHTPEHRAPSSRSKHAMCVAQDGFFYLLGGRSANLPLKDLWRFDPVSNRWEEVRSKGCKPPCLQEHTIVSWKSKLYVFGGEIGFASTGETPLWIFDLATSVWRKQSSRCGIGSGGDGSSPSGRRGHSSVVYNGAMHLYGGYQDLRGSSSELWRFHFDTEQWELVCQAEEIPPARHNHSCVVYEGAMWVYGGMTDLQERADFWRYHFATNQWHRVKCQKGGPLELHSHAAVQAQGSMYFFGGERGGSANNELWRYHFATETWERIHTEGALPNPRCRHVALVNPSLPTWADRVAPPAAADVSGKYSDLPVVRRQHQGRLPVKSTSMVLNGTQRRPFRFKVHPVSRLCSKRTGSDDDDDDAYVAAYNHHTSQVNLRSLKEKLSSSRLVRSISSGNYGIASSGGGAMSADRTDELRKLLEESPRLPPASLQKSQSSEAVLEPSDSESSTPQHRIVSIRPLSEILPKNFPSILPERLSPPPHNHRSRRITASRSLNFASATPAGATNPSTSCCCSPTSSSDADTAHSPCENAQDNNTYPQSDTTQQANDRRDLLIDLSRSDDAEEPRGGRFTSRYTSYSTLSELTSQTATPIMDLPHSVSHCSGYYSFAEDDPELQRDIVNFLSGNGPRSRPVSYAAGGALELKTFYSAAAQPGIQVMKERARSWDRVSQRTPAAARGVSHPRMAIQSIKEESCQGTPVRGKWPQTMSPNRAKIEQHHWQLCLYVFGGREQGAPGLYRQPMSIWQLYI